MDEFLRFIIGKNERMVGFDKMNFRNVFWKNRIIVGFDIVSCFLEERTRRVSSLEMENRRF